jgi:hypothetical protein
MNLPLMPKATAVWLIENTTLTFDQIAAFCGMHSLEVKGIADGEVALGIIGQDPVASGQLTAAEITRCEASSVARLELSFKAKKHTEAKKKKGARYTPVARRQDKPDAVAWFVKHCPEISDAQITKMIGTTKATIKAIRDRTHWNTANIRPRDPVLLGLCTQSALDATIEKARNVAQTAKSKKDQLAGKAPTV